MRNNHAPTNYELGQVLLAESRPIEAEGVLSKAVIVEEDNAVYLLALTDAQVKNKKYDIALDTLLKIVNTEPNNLRVVFSLCNVYSKKRYYTAAIDFCERALNLSPKGPDIMNRLAWLYAKKRMKLDRGIELINLVTKAYPNSAKYIDTFSELLYAKGDIVGAVKSIREAIRLDPENSYYKQQIWKFKNVALEPLQTFQN